MNKLKKTLVLVCCAALLVCISVGATLAYLLDQTDVVTNTFTVGDVEIDLDEAKVDEYGDYVTDHKNRVKENSYKLLPGHEYIKDPTVTVNAKSEDSYIRIKVAVPELGNLVTAFPAAVYPDFYDGDLFLLQKLVKGWDAKVWPCVGFANNTYEFRYTGENAEDGIVEYSEAKVVLEPLFTHVIIPGTINDEDLAGLQGIKINITADAIQADGFKGDVNAAWAAFDGQKALEDEKAAAQG